MKKKPCFVLLASIQFCSVNAQDTVSIISKIQITTATVDRNKEAHNRITTALKSGDGSALFKGFCILGPRLWEHYKQSEALKNIPEGNVDFKIPLFDKTGARSGMGVAKGKLIQDAGHFATVWHNICIDLKGENPFLLLPQDLSQRDKFHFWLLFANKMEEPVFIIDSNNKRLLFKTVNNAALFFIEDMTFD
jgi:hypothetical protein